MLLHLSGANRICSLSQELINLAMGNTIVVACSFENAADEHASLPPRTYKHIVKRQFQPIFQS